MSLLKITSLITPILLLTTIGSIASSPFDLDASGQMENGWTHWNPSNTVLDLSAEPGWAYFKSKPVNNDWGMSFYTFPSGIPDIQPPYAIEAHFKQDPPDGEGGYLQALVVCYTNNGQPGQGYALVGGKGYYGSEQRIIAFSDQSWGGQWTEKSSGSFTDSSIENASDLYVIFEVTTQGTYRFGFKKSLTDAYVYMAAQPFPSGNYNLGGIQVQYFPNGGHGVSAAASPDHWTYKTDFVHLIEDYGIVPTPTPVPVPVADASIQGFLKTDSGDPIQGSFNYRLQFFDAATGGSSLSPEIEGTMQTSVRGLFIIPAPVYPAVLDSDSVFYQLWVDTNGNGIDEGDRFSDRVAVRQAPFSKNAMLAESTQWDDISNIPAGFADGVDNQVNEYPSFYNVKDYGATGDGTTDDTAAIQSALNAARRPGGTVYFPPGVYSISSLNLTDTVKTVILQGPASGWHSATLMPNQSNVHVLDLTGSAFIILKGLTIGDALQSVTPQSAILLSQSGSNFVSNAVHFQDLYVSGKYSVATVYCYGVPSSDMVNCDFYNYYDGDSAVMWFTHNNEAGIQSSFTAVNPQGSNCSDWTLLACEIHEMSSQHTGQPSQATALRLSNTHQMRWVGGNISGNGPQVIRFNGTNHHVCFVGTTLYSEVGGFVAPSLFYNAGTIAGLTVRSCVAQAGAQIFGGNHGTTFDEIVFQGDPGMSYGSADHLINCPNSTLRNSIIHCDGLQFNMGTIEGTNLLINPGAITASTDRSDKL